ncbi:hypothetical protein FPV16_20645 [Methylobacterium sp. W2]|uniref:hypothetical protein n=1 Tax=Methylobacterium sp. W2 TaxID=2598107 RepID=UPI001D0CCAEC|nr:hypothetical protein [Methylobacterium sp. W2]MCC0808586.1 hypothetical protein [Methylobacterium sp. W2]
MAQAFAIATLHVCRKRAEMKDGKVVTPADIEVVPAGKIADISDEDFKVFEKAGAARRPTRMDRAMSEGEEEPEAVETAAGRVTAAKPAR